MLTLSVFIAGTIGEQFKGTVALRRLPKSIRHTRLDTAPAAYYTALRQLAGAEGVARHSSGTMPVWRGEPPTSAPQTYPTS